MNRLREAGALEVHFRVSSPPITHPCFYGIDTAARKELVASTHSIEDTWELIGADTLAFISEPDGRPSAAQACVAHASPGTTPRERRC